MHAAQQQLSWLSVDDSADRAGSSRSGALTSTPGSRLSAHQARKRHCGRLCASALLHCCTQFWKLM